MRVPVLALCLAVLPLSAPADDAAALYREHCAGCHGPDRLGGMGPALLPENLGRLRKSEALHVIRDGRPATQMPGFGGKLAEREIASLAELVYRPLPEIPRWDLAEMRASHVMHLKAGEKRADKPVFDADPLNLFIVVELGDHHATLLDGDRFEPILRFPTRFALHGGPKYSPDGRYVYFASRDGWISKFDIWNLKYVAEIRAGINTRNLAVSSDGKYVMVGNYLPHALVVLDARDLAPLKVIPVRDDAGKSSRVSAVYDAGPRKSFIAALKDIPEVWEVPYDPDHEPIYPGYVHDYRMGEAIAARGPFPVRRIKLDDYLDDFFFDPPYRHLIGAAREGKNGQVVSLLVGRKIADVELPGLPHLGSGITWDYRGKPVLATPNLKEGTISIIDMTQWKTIRRIETLGPGFFLRSHEGTRYAWADNMMSPRKDTIQLIDKETLTVARALTPAPGKTAAHVEFTRDGKYALVSVWEMDGALVVYDARTLEEVKRLPMKKPSGKYNVHNKITRSSGTSH
ncbi:cytochrome Cbb3 [Sulfurifustis variabilis]|uniref:Cytochrome Cbb3 n=1 Tax=Sulfurifustis variabilis TaxID=1675686 RepID=A0A1B4V386_9GAMM|nr:nitrite reductase [Sulfurifustis variabilis]BAU46942.1 cytochrome Cbb3 [Sulfurifustis variabilis]